MEVAGYFENKGKSKQISFLKTESKACMWGYSWYLQVFFPKFVLSKLIAMVTSENRKMKLVTSVKWL